MRRLSEYENYRVYLKDHYNTRKEDNPCYSYRMFTRMAGFKAPNILKMVIDGHRNLTIDSARKFSKGLKHTEAEMIAFMALVEKNQHGWPVQIGVRKKAPL